MVVMKQITASHAKQNFGELLEACADQPVAIGRHGRVRAVICSPEVFNRHSPEADALAQRRLARAERDLQEKQRLIDHQRLAIRLLTAAPEQAQEWVEAARVEVRRWRELGLCSVDFADRWDAMLQQPIAALAQAMGSDNEAWGAALRRNSPWSVVRT